MKKYLFLTLAALTGLFTACQQEQEIVVGEGNCEATVSITIPEGQLSTRTVAQGSAHFVDPTMSNMRVALIVSNEQGKVLNVYTGTHDFGTNGQTAYNFKVRFVKGQAYNITAWADFGADYYTLPAQPDSAGNLSDAVITAATTRTGSLNTNDCYYKNELIQLSSNKSINLTLKRPVALVKVNTTDWDLNEVKYANFRPDFYQTKVTAPTDLNLVSGVAGNAQEITCSAQIVEYDQDGNPKEIHYDYFFANDASGILPNFTVNYYQGGQVQETALSDYTFENIPVQRNYKTNISGNILTKQGDINVTIDNSWSDPDKEIDLIDVVAMVGDTKFKSLADAVATAKDSTYKVVTIVASQEYTLPDVSGITVETAAGIGAYFTIASSGNIANAAGATLKGLTFNLPLGNYTGFQGADVTFENCAFSGLLTTYNGSDKQIFKNCSFKSSGNNYSVNAYGNCSFEGCTFTCDQGKAIYLFTESGTAGYKVDFDGCTFTNSGSTCRKPAILVKTRATDQGAPYTNGYKVTITNNCTASGFADFNSKDQDVYDYASDGLWGVETKAGDDLTYSATHLDVNGTRVYPHLYPDVNTANLWHIIDAKGLKAMQYEINSQKKDYSGRTVQLDADINLNNETWTPIECKQNGFGTLNGNNHTISNFKVNVFEDTIRHAGLFGSLGCGTVKNLKINYADVTGVNHVGAIVGYGMCAKIDSCTVSNSTVKAVVKNNDDGDKAGAICGYLSAENDAQVTHCTVTSCAISAYRDCGGAVGMASGPAIVTNNNITGSTISYSGETGPSENPENFAEVVGRTDGSPTISNNPTSGNTVSGANN